VRVAVWLTDHGDRDGCSPTRQALGHAEMNPSEVSSLTVEKGVLENAASDLIRLLMAVDSCGYNLYDGPALQRAIWRYETMWLPLLGGLFIALKSPDTTPIDDQNISEDLKNEMTNIAGRLRAHGNLQQLEIVPPLDVAWVWYIHRLSAGLYLNDVARVIGSPLAPDVLSAFQYGVANNSRWSRIWRVAFPPEQRRDSLAAKPDAAFRDYFPFYLQSLVNARGKVAARQARVGSVNSVSYNSKFKYNIAKAVFCHRGVLWLYMRNREIAKDFLRSAVLRYESFLLLRATHPGTQLEPTEDIELIWRVHIAALADYLSDDLVALAFDPHILTPRALSNERTDTIFAHSDASFVHYDESMGAEGRKRFLEETQKVWFEHFGESRGQYLQPSHAPRLTPGGKRDGYLQEVLRRKLAGGAYSSSSSSSSGSSSDDFGMDEARNPGTTRLVASRKYVSNADRPPVVSIRRARQGVTSSQTLSVCTTVDDLVTTFSPSRSSGVSETPSSPQTIQRQYATVNSTRRAKRLRFDSTKNVAHPASDDEGRIESARVRRKERSEMKKRRAEERQIQRDARVRQSHGFNSNLKKDSVSRAQAIRALVIGLAGAALVVTGAIVMGKPENSTRVIGVSLFFCGLVSALAATVALQRPDAKERAEVKANAKSAKERRTAADDERKKAKVEKAAFFNAIQQHSFSNHEAQIVIGGGASLLCFTGS
jgi:Glycine-rich domain-containing protein-like